MLGRLPSSQVGDHKQLSATVISQAAADMGYSRSMFARLQEHAYPSDMLNVQYRCVGSVQSGTVGSR
jgi:superfamily I DNA and/or RNA helicase